MGISKQFFPTATPLFEKNQQKASRSSSSKWTSTSAIP
jgi:hypothetical protein